MKLSSRILGLLLPLFFFHSLGAVEMKGLFEVEIMVKSRSDEDRVAAIKKALLEVLGRIVVSDNVWEEKVVKTAIASASDYVKQFQYAMTTGNRWIKDDRTRLMRVLFDEAQLLELLRSADVGVWSEIRPETLVWLIVEGRDGNRTFYEGAGMPDLENALTKAAEMKGLPVIFPLLDLEERQKISVNEVLSADSKQLLAVSQRYDPVSILAGRISDKGKCWEAEWALHFDEEITQWASSCVALDKTMLDGMQKVYDVLSKYYGVKPEAAETGPSGIYTEFSVH